MRLTVMDQMAKGIASETNRPQELEEGEDVNVDPASIEKSLERVKWFLWHGNVYRALEVIEGLDCRLESIEGSSEKQRKLLKVVREFGNYSPSISRPSRITGIDIDMGKRSRRRLWNRRSIMWSVSGW